MPDQVEQAGSVHQAKRGAQAPQGPLPPAGIKALKIGIVVMGLMIVVCVIVIIGRIIYLTSAPDATETAGLNAPSQLPASVDFPLPVGASVQHVSLDGARAAVTFQVKGQTKIGIFNMYSGKKLTEIRLTAEPPSAK